MRDETRTDGGQGVGKKNHKVRDKVAVTVGGRHKRINQNGKMRVEDAGERSS